MCFRFSQFILSANTANKTLTYNRIKTFDAQHQCTVDASPVYKSPCCLLSISLNAQWKLLNNLLCSCFNQTHHHHHHQNNVYQCCYRFSVIVVIIVCVCVSLKRSLILVCMMKCFGDEYSGKKAGDYWCLLCKY